MNVSEINILLHKKERKGEFTFEDDVSWSSKIVLDWISFVFRSIVAKLCNNTVYIALRVGRWKRVVQKMEMVFTLPVTSISTSGAAHALVLLFTQRVSHDYYCTSRKDE